MAYRDRYVFESLRIRAYMMTPVIADTFLPLDGILLYQAHRMQEGHGPEYTIPGAYTTRDVPTLPLHIIHPQERDWYYACSWAQWGPYADGQDHWNKRFDLRYTHLLDFGKKKGRVNTQSGWYRAYHMPIYYRSALWINWYCVGDMEEIDTLLSVVTHIGKKTAQGWGRVKRWEIVPWPEDWSVWNGRKLMRGVPPRDAEQYGVRSPIVNYGIRPSYWKRSNQMPLVMPS